MFKKNRYFFQLPSLFLLSFVIVGVGIRLPLMFLPMDGDEGINFTYFAVLPWAKLFTQYLTPNQHTFYIAVAYVFRIIFGESEFIFRLPALLTGIISIFLIYKISLGLIRSHFVAISASTLITFSLLNYQYSIRGRGYTTTLFLSLLLIYAVISIFKNRHATLWRWIFVLGGLSLILTLPSNACFLGGISIFFLTLKYKNENIYSLIFSKNFYKEICFIIFTATLSLSYFWIIRSDLAKGIWIYRNYAITVGENIDWSFSRLIQIWSGLFQPWGLWLFAIFIYGFIKLRKNNYFESYIAFFLFIFIFQGILNILPPSRSFIFLLPIIFIITGYGFKNILFNLIKRLSLNYKNIIFILFWLLILTPAYFKLTEFYKQRVQQVHLAAKIADSKEALIYLRNKIPTDSLIILPTIDRALTHYLVKEVTKRNVNAIKKRRIENIYFIGSEPFKFLSFGAPMESPKNEWFFKSDISRNIFRKIYGIGGLGVFKFSGNIINLSSSPDFESFFLKPNNSFNLSTNLNYLERVEGELSLNIFNKTKLITQIKTSKVMGLDSSLYPWTLILQTYFNKHWKPGQVLLIDNEMNSVPFYYSFNHLQGAFKLNGTERILPFERLPYEWHYKMRWGITFKTSKDDWLVKIKLTPLQNKLSMGVLFELWPKENTFDGLGFYLLVP